MSYGLFEFVESRLDLDMPVKVILLQQRHQGGGDGGIVLNELMVEAGETEKVVERGGISGSRPLNHRVYLTRVGFNP